MQAVKPKPSTTADIVPFRKRILVQDVAHAKTVLKRLAKYKILVVDTETTGLAPFNGDRVIGISIKGYGKRKSYYFPFRHEEGKNLPLYILDYFADLLSDEEKLYIGFNYKFDMLSLLQDGIPLPAQIEDVQCAAHLMNETLPLSLKPLCDYYLGEGHSVDEEELVDRIIERGYCSEHHRKKAKGLMYRLPPEDVAPYACADVELTEALRDFFVVPVEHEDDGIIYYESVLESWGQEQLYKDFSRYQLIFTHIEARGAKMNRKRVKRYLSEAEPHVKTYSEKIFQICGERVNPGSPVQIKDILGIDNAQAETLEDFVTFEQGDPARLAIAKALIEYKDWVKVISTYFRPYLELMDENNVIHTNFNITGTNTSRLSSNNPNLQNVPRNKTDSEAYQRVKKCFVARKGYKLVSMDYSQAEIILGANYSQDPVLVSIVTKGLSMHDVTAENCGIPRQAAKTINFGVDYGMQYRLLAKKLKISHDKAKEYLGAYWKNFKEKHKLFKACQLQAEMLGYIKLWNGRYLHFPAQRPTYAAMNALIQGGIAAVMMHVTLNIWDWIQGLKNPDDVHILLQVHDQLVFEVKEDKLDKYVPKLKKLMESLPTENEKGEELPFTIPLKVDTSVGPSWGELEDIAA